MSSFAWLDFSESDRQKTLDVIDLFREKGTVDELGIGTIRDAIADLLFPGTSTIMTRARYYLFVPWIYLRHEKKKTASSEIAQAARKDEIALIDALIDGGDRRGVIGIDARASLKRLPSTVYWQALGVLGIRRYPRSREHYHRAMDSFHTKGDEVLRGDDKHVIAGGQLRRWDASLPPAPLGFPRTATTMELSEEEANYLRERVMLAAPRSLFAFLVNHPVHDVEIPFPWEHPLRDQFSAQNRTELTHARNFAETLHGAALLYNLMLAEKNKDDDLVSAYDARMDDWVAELQSRQRDLAGWNHSEFWSLVHGTGSHITRPTEAFVTHWLAKVAGKDVSEIRSSKTARALVTAREKALKGPLARLDSTRSLNWGGASSSERLDYRWNRPVQTILADIRTPLD